MMKSGVNFIITRKVNLITFQYDLTNEMKLIPDI